MADSSSVYMDTCCFIDVVKRAKGISIETNQEKDIWTAQQFLYAARDGEITIYTSSLTMAEFIGVRASKKDPMNIDAETQRLIGAIIGSGRSGVIPIQPDYFVIKAARDLAWVHGFSAVKPMDRMHLASALSVTCGEFLTTDDRLASATRKALLSKLGMRICNAKDSNLLPSKYRQLEIHGSSREDIK